MLVPEITTNQIADLANIPEENRLGFNRAVNLAVRVAHNEPDRGNKTPTSAEIGKHLNKLQRALEALQQQNPGENAGFVFEAMSPASIPELLDAISRARNFANTHYRGRGQIKGGVLGGAPSKLFHDLIINAQIRGGKFTCTRNPDENKVTGTFIEALILLLDYLPENFFGKAGMSGRGNSIWKIFKTIVE